MSGAPLLFDHASKQYATKLALAQVSFQLDAGERVALLGRNGAGKTTALRLALGLARPTTGSCRLFGQSPRREQARRLVGYAPQLTTMPSRLRVRELIRLVRDAKGAGEPGDLVECLGVESYLHNEAGALSLGQRRRLALLLAFIGEPELAVLDEPTSSLDASSRRAAWDFISDYCRDGGTLLLASHDFGEVAQLTNRALVLEAGHLRADSGLADLLNKTNVAAVEIPPNTSASPAAASHVIHSVDKTVLLTRDPEVVIEHLVTTSDGITILRRRPTLEEVCLVLGGSRDK